MLISEQKPLEEILSSLEGEEAIFLIGARGVLKAVRVAGSNKLGK